MNKIIHYFAVLILFSITAISPAKACRGAMEENTIFFEKDYNSKFDSDITAKIILDRIINLDKKPYNIAFARITDVIEASAMNIQQGDNVQLQYEYTSCGPNHKAGDEGIIIAKISVDEKGKIILYPYERRYSDNQINPPIK